MEEISKIITAISDVTGLDRHSIIYGRTDECKKARGILCYIALKDKYGLTMTLAEVLGKSRSQCIFMSDFCKEGMEESIGYVMLMNEIRKKLGMSAIMTDKIEEVNNLHKKREKELSRKRSKENSQRLFGIEYSIEDEIRMFAAMKSANEFMAKYCQIGNQANPLLCD